MDNDNESTHADLKARHQILIGRIGRLFPGLMWRSAIQPHGQHFSDSLKETLYSCG